MSAWSAPWGDDFGEEEYAVLRERGVNTEDIERVEGGRTFFWQGEYEWNLNIRHTLDTQLNVFGEFEPKLSGASADADVLFLANIQPDLQRQLLHPMSLLCTLQSKVHGEAIDCAR